MGGRDINLVVNKLAIIAAIVMVAAFSSMAVRAADLGSQLRNIDNNIKQSETQIDNLDGQQQTLKGAIASLNLQISNISTQITNTRRNIYKTEAEISQAEIDLAKKKLILAENMQLIYKSGNVSSIEVLASSDNFSEFFDKQYYLDRIKEHIQDSSNTIVKLKKDLEARRASLGAMATQLKVQEESIAVKRAEQQRILTASEGEEGKYKVYVQSLSKQRLALEAQLRALASGNGPSANLGYVGGGQKIGLVGTTGYSTGNHLHFTVYRNGVEVDPIPLINNGTLQWPVPALGRNNISQYFGKPNWAAAYDFHNGIDIASGSSNPAVVAAAPGTIIFKGWNSYGFGYMVMIDHGGGLKTLYGHMVNGS